MRLNAKQIAAYTGGQFLIDPIDPSALMCGITWDSREVRPGWLYVALPGERVDGHDFVGAALRAGAAGALVMQRPDAAASLLAREMGAAIIEVANTASAITDLARAWRGHLRGRVIGLTGSVGKTTTKNLTRDVCSAYGSTVATRANQNNELGVPRTLLAADPETAVVVVEMGMRGAGQIAALCDFVRPDWGVVTNVGESHIELLGSRENIARAKSELYAALPAGTGRAFLNLDEPMLDILMDAGDVRERPVALVGFEGHPDEAACELLERDETLCEEVVWAEDVTLDAEGRARFTLCARDHADVEELALFAPVERCACELALTGRHNVDNACAAAAVGYALGLDLETIAAALSASVPEPGRQEVIAARGGFTIVNDAYNASPDSMRASLSTFAATEVAGRRIAVLGDMGELGDFAEACHRGVGAHLAGLPIQRVICVGELAAFIAEGAAAAGMDAARISRAATVADVLEELDTLLEPGDAVLVKASHFMGLTRVVEGLVH
ncbi:UDP-N-acetylmuramoyl-tripeptide--D-alanyl-D-alanine ligase [Enterorhabdus mucosicola]|uniref:UDP-N-acetylmuramoyl-tripeptide--D-alanyl-D-alanine ligase n=1 Tax=Adlercreutzia mucosicola TaxID=580026 RepID=A0A6N8JM86_9ACTN|nr:UDP-N-acetylmuramoyl-tripeptide--D-alanyl-D-alanine ligase [Adlercreutzia mucosicola]